MKICQRSDDPMYVGLAMPTHREELDEKGKGNKKEIRDKGENGRKQTKNRKNRGWTIDGGYCVNLRKTLVRALINSSATRCSVTLAYVTAVGLKGTIP